MLILHRRWHSMKNDFETKAKQSLFLLYFFFFNNSLEQWVIWFDAYKELRRLNRRNYNKYQSQRVVIFFFFTNASEIETLKIDE